MSLSLKRRDLGRNNALTMYVSPAIIKKDVPARIKPLSSILYKLH